MPTGMWVTAAMNNAAATARVLCAAFCGLLFAFFFVASAGASPPASIKTISVDLKLGTGGELSGAVIDHDAHGLVILHDDTPYVFAWNELDGGSAFAVRRSLLTLHRGDADKLSADDHFDLGVFALAQGRNDLAANEFEAAKKMRPDLALRIREAFDGFRRRKQTAKIDEPLTRPEVEESAYASGPASPTNAPLGEASALPDLTETNTPAHPLPEVGERVREAYLRFGAKVQEVMGKDIAMIESDHFLIWTDWEKSDRGRLIEWCEAMYAALCERFGLDPRDDIFLARCPVFCFRSKARFRKFARDFDGYDGREAIGYTRSIEKNGHVHMVFARVGRSEADYDRFACTLVHEGTHAFLHRLYGPKLLPHWVNEGYADLTAERILGDRCPHGGNAALLARQYARHDWPIAGLLESTSTIGVHQYPLAHSVVVYLESLGRDRFAGFIKGLKNGATVADALAGNYDGMTFVGLEQAWKDAIRKAD
ncbi:MAG: hypothetical protein Q7R41_16720, partial [Phycisphaerales bacterium]|nr:hypothetical protein [Phycisphaerales bacterium]